VAAGDGTQSQLVRPDNGWTITPDDLEDLTKTLKIALSDPPGLRKKGLESYRIVRDEINIEKMVEVFISAINSVCKL
jgi:glycosyltransferase involved in cell wall biosynthesis